MAIFAVQFSKNSGERCRAELDCESGGGAQSLQAATVVWLRCQGAAAPCSRRSDFGVCELQSGFTRRRLRSCA